MLRVKRRITRYLSAVLRALARRNVDDSTEALRGGTSGKTLASKPSFFGRAIRLRAFRLGSCRNLYMSAFGHEFASARIRASRGLALIVFIIAFSHGSFAASQACEEKIITRTETIALTSDSREARVTLDVLVDRDAVVKAALSAKAMGNFGGSDARQKWADVTTSGASLRCEGGEASQCSAWYDCGDATDASGAVDNQGGNQT